MGLQKSNIDLRRMEKKTRDRKTKIGEGSINAKLDRDPCDQNKRLSRRQEEDSFEGGRGMSPPLRQTNFDVLYSISIF
jgi:hypothetical protein